MLGRRGSEQRARPAPGGNALPSRPHSAFSLAPCNETATLRRVQSASPVVLLTGASSGIGAACARLLVSRNCRVTLLARRRDRLEALQREIDPTGQRTLLHVGDLTDPAVRRACVAATLAHFGRLDILINNAGYGHRGPLERVSLEALRANYETNVFSLIGLVQEVAPHLRAQGGGRIINIGSVAGRIARPLTSVYDSTKHALEALTDGLRGELRPWGIRVSLIRPGFITTEFIEAANQVSATTLAEAGPYAPYFAGHHQRNNGLRRVAAGPEVIARLVAHAALSPSPKSHYNGPFHAKVFLFLKWLLPVALFDRILGLRPKKSRP